MLMYLSQEVNVKRAFLKASHKINLVPATPA